MFSEVMDDLRAIRRKTNTAVFIQLSRHLILYSSIAKNFSKKSFKYSKTGGPKFSVKFIVKLMKKSFPPEVTKQRIKNKICTEIRSQF